MVKTKNKYKHPIEPGSNVRMTYDESPAHNNNLKHAVDFIVPEGTVVKAALDGTVIDVKQDSNVGGADPKFDEYGNYIEIKHSNNEYSVYEHIRKNGSLVKRGDKIKTGQIIGYSGSTGWIANLGPHLHFDVHKYYGNGPNDYQTLEINWDNGK